MLIRKLTARQKVQATAKYVRNRLQHRPMLASIEMTKHCNAGCDFCDDWKTTHSPKLGDVVDMARVLNPMVLALTGGEPLIEKGLPEIIREVKASQSFIYLYDASSLHPDVYVITLAFLIRIGPYDTAQSPEIDVAPGPGFAVRNGPSVSTSAQRSDPAMCAGG